MVKHLIALCVVVSLVAMGSLALAQKNPCNPCAQGGHMFHVDDPMKRNTITFKSEAPLEDIIGTTNDITGHINFDPRNPSKGGKATFIVATASLTTGIPLRDEHLAGEAWLNAAKYPKITLDIKKVNKVTLVKEGQGSATYDADVTAELSVKGKTLPVSFVARITYLKESEQTKTKMPGDLLAVRARFNVDLTAYGLMGPPGAGLIGTKVGQSIEVSVSVVATNSMKGKGGNPCGPKKAKNPCNPCGPKKAKNPCNPCG